MYLPLHKTNELMLAIIELSGGRGFICRLEVMPYACVPAPGWQCPSWLPSSPFRKTN